jgi:hypothetical protein
LTAFATESGSTVTVSGTGTPNSTATTTAIDPPAGSDYWTGSTAVSSNGTYSLSFTNPAAPGNPLIISVMDGSAVAKIVIEANGTIINRDGSSTVATLLTIGGITLTGPSIFTTYTPIGLTATIIQPNGSVDTAINGSLPITIAISPADSGATVPTTADFVNGIATFSVTLTEEQDESLTITLEDQGNWTSAPLEETVSLIKPL